MKNNWTEQLPANLQRVERDHIPRQVAIEMLCRPANHRQSNRERKMYMQALETRYESTRQPKENRRQQILANRLRSRPWSFLVSRNRRCINIRGEVQHAYVVGNRHLAKLKEKTGKPDPRDTMAILILERQMAALEVRAKELDLAWECLTDEIERRQKNIVALAANKTN